MRFTVLRDDDEAEARDVFVTDDIVAAVYRVIEWSLESGHATLADSRSGVVIEWRKGRITGRRPLEDAA